MISEKNMYFIEKLKESAKDPEIKVHALKITGELVQYVIKGNVFGCHKQRLREAIRDVYYWQYAHGTNFSSMLMGLIAKADNENKARFLTEFSPEVCAYLLWYYKKVNDKKYDTDADFFEEMDKELQ